MKKKFRQKLYILSLSLFIFLSGCAGLSGENAEKQVLRASFNQSIVSLDPHGSDNGSQGMHIAARQIYDTLVEKDGMEIIPSVAQDWTQPDPNTWVFNLRNDVTFHDGEQLTARDVKASLERLANSDSPLASLWEALDSIETIDEYTINITTSEPLGTMLTNLTLMYIVPADKIDEADFFRKPIGSGPFKVKSFAPEQELILTKNDEYWDGSPRLEQLELVDIPETSARLTALRTGEIDIAWTIPPDQISELEGISDVVLKEESSYLYYFLWFNSSRQPFDDVRVRRAMWHAIDIESIVTDLFSGSAETLKAPIPSPVIGYSEQKLYEYNPELAKKLLTEAGYPDGFSTTLMWDRAGGPQILQLADTIRSQWAEIGIDVEPLQFERAQWLEKLLALDWDMELQTNTVLTGDADYTLGRLYNSEANRNGYANEDLDEILISARTETDQEKRKDLYEKANKIIWEEAVGIFPLELKQVYGIRSNVKGFEPDPAGTPSFYKVAVE